MIIETYLDPTELTNNQSLVILDDDGKRWDVSESLSALAPPSSGHVRDDRVILERWRVELGNPSNKVPADLGAVLPTVYKKSIVLFRSLYTYSKFLPAFMLSKRQSQLGSRPPLKMRYRIFEDSRGTVNTKVDNLTVPLYDDGGKSKTTDTYNFGATESPAGPFSVEVTFRTNCEFRVDDSEKLLSSRFMGADDNFFRPSLPSDDDYRGGEQEVGSLPVGKKDGQRPDLSQAYGSLSTFHQVGAPTGSSPLSALRAARDLGNASSGSPTYAPPSPKLGQAARLAMRSGEGSAPVQRRPSVSFQPFKAPPLSASPSLVDPPYGSSPRNAYGRTPPLNNSADDKSMPPPAISASASRKPTYPSPDNAIVSSTSASPRGAPITKYSSSFSHRRGRLSSGAVNKVDDDNISSGKASASSSTAQPSSGVLAEAGGTSSGSVHADEDNISEFLKMLDQGKGLLTSTDTAGLDASTKRTSAALSRFQKMRDSNAVLSESMSSSLLHRSSATSSKYLPGIPPSTSGPSAPTSSSPGKPISPHTPHTPAIPSRLSSQSIVEYPVGTHDGHLSRHPQRELDTAFDENTNDPSALEPTTTNANAIDIPTSPRPFIPNYRRSSSAAQRRPSPPLEDDLGDDLPFGMRSISLGAEDRPPLSLSDLIRQQNNNDAAPINTAENDQAQQGDNESTSDTPAHRGGRGSTTSSNRSYQPRFAYHRGRGSFGLPHSHSSTSSSLGRGNAVPSHGSDREPYVGSEGTTPETRRAYAGGVGRRFSLHRPAPSGNNLDEDEPLLFTMSDFGVSRRSLEEQRRGGGGSGGNESPAGSGGSRRGSGRRGGSSGSFQAWH